MVWYGMICINTTDIIIIITSITIFRTRVVTTIYGSPLLFFLHVLYRIVSYKPFILFSLSFPCSPIHFREQLNFVCYHCGRKQFVSLFPNQNENKRTSRSPVSTMTTNFTLLLRYRLFFFFLLISSRFVVVDVVIVVHLSLIRCQIAMVYDAITPRVVVSTNDIVMNQVIHLLLLLFLLHLCMTTIVIVLCC